MYDSEDIPLRRNGAVLGEELVGKFFLKLADVAKFLEVFGVVVGFDGVFLRGSIRYETG